MIGVLVAEDQALIRGGIVMLLNAQPDIEVVGEAVDGREAVALARELRPDLVLMDLRMPELDGIAATQQIVDERIAGPDHLVKVLVLTTFNDDDLVHEALVAGASGFLLKHAAPADLPAAVRAVAGGHAYLHPEVAAQVIGALSRLPGKPRQTSSSRVARLTPREREVLVCVARGMTNAEISDHFVLSEATVKTHVARILTKTGCGDRAQAVALAYLSGLVRP